MADAITGDNGIGLWALASHYTGKMREYWLINETGTLILQHYDKKITFKPSCATTQKRQKLVTEMHHKHFSSIATSTTPKKLTAGLRSRKESEHFGWSRSLIPKNSRSRSRFFVRLRLQKSNSIIFTSHSYVFFDFSAEPW